MTEKLPYPFARSDEHPYYTVALGNGEYVRVVLAGNYDATVAELERYKDLYASEIVEKAAKNER